MVTITGRIVRGMGVAAVTVAKQMPFFQRVCPELVKCKCATINVALECQLDATPDFMVGPIDWEGKGTIELFGFLRAKFEIVEPEIKTDAWVYIPYNSAYRQNPFYAEILAPEISLGQAVECKIHLKGKKVIA